tara:strand:+ start:45276 stop:45641 length:366 start_codon:yes stop_codon:yes gene_type:complete
MSVYFTISGAYYPAEADTVVYLDNGITVKVAPQVRSIQYGDGYSLDISLAPPLRSLGGSFSNRTPAEINIIETYFIALGGDTIPNFVIDDETVSVSVIKFNKDYINGEVFSLSAEFKEEHR